MGILYWQPDSSSSYPIVLSWHIPASFVVNVDNRFFGNGKLKLSQSRLKSIVLYLSTRLLKDMLEATMSGMLALCVAQQCRPCSYMYMYMWLFIGRLELILVYVCQEWYVKFLMLQAWTHTYTTRAFTWDSFTYSSSIIQQVTIAVNIPNVWGVIDKLVTQGLQPWACRIFCNSPREVDWCKFLLYITFGSRVIKTLTSLIWMQICFKHSTYLHLHVCVYGCAHACTRLIIMYVSVL